MARPRKYRQVVKALVAYDERFRFFENRAKGSERMIYHPDIGGRSESYPIKCHGLGTEIGVGVLSAIIRRFKLPRKIFG